MTDIDSWLKFGALTNREQLRLFQERLNKLQAEKESLYKLVADTDSERRRMEQKRRFTEPIIDLQIKKF